MSGTEEAIAISTGDFKASEGLVTVHEFSKKERLTRAIIRGLIGVLVSALLILVPLLHFILPPIGLIITFFLVRSAYANSKILEQGSGKCPACHQVVQIFKRPYRFPFNEVCENCRRPLSVSLRA